MQSFSGAPCRALRGLRTEPLAELRVEALVKLYIELLAKLPVVVTSQSDHAKRWSTEPKSLILPQLTS